MSDPLNYAPHMIKVSQGLRHARDSLLKNQHDEAIATVEEMIAELRLAKAAIQDNKERF